MVFTLIFSGCKKSTGWDNDDNLGEISIETQQETPTPQPSQSEASETPEPTETGSEETTEHIDLMPDEYGYYFSQLTPEQEQLYAQLLRGVEAFEPEIELSSKNEEDIYKAYFAMSRDHAELFWITPFTVWQYENSNTRFEFNIPENVQELITEVNAEIDKVVEGIPEGANDYEKVKYFYEWIVNNTEYVKTENDQNILSVFIDHKSVCAGYSKAFQCLCNRVHIPCIYVGGYVHGNESHAWNMVKINDNFYWVDVTWGDPVFLNEDMNTINYNYLCATDEDIKQTHTLDASVKITIYESNKEDFVFPSCTDNSLNYYKLKGVYFEDYDYYTIRDYLLDKFSNNILTDIELKFISQPQLEQFMADFLDEEDPEILQIYAEAHPDFYGTFLYNFVYIEESAYISISVEPER